MKKLRVPLRVVFYKDGQDWIAHCLEFDLLGDGQNQHHALARLAQAIVLQADASVQSGNPANLFKPADAKLFMMFAAGNDIRIGELRMDLDTVTIDEMEAREYVVSDSEIDLRVTVAVVPR